MVSLFKYCTTPVLPGQLGAPVISSTNPRERLPTTISRLTTLCCRLLQSGSLSCSMVSATVYILQSSVYSEPLKYQVMSVYNLFDLQ